MGTRECGHMSAMASPSIGEAGRTGQWRTMRPVVDHTRCVSAQSEKAVCFRCWVFCPEVVIAKRVPIAIDLDYCKGCGICVEVCPSGAIRMVAEARDEDGD